MVVPPENRVPGLEIATGMPVTGGGKPVPNQEKTQTQGKDKFLIFIPHHKQR